MTFERYRGIKPLVQFQAELPDSLVSEWSVRMGYGPLAGARSHTGASGNSGDICGGTFSLSSRSGLQSETVALTVSLPRDSLPLTPPNNLRHRGDLRR